MTVLEDTQRALAELVSFTRTYTCPLHAHVSVLILTPDGPTEWHGPACEIANELENCEFIAHRQEVLAKAYEALGTKDMSNYL